MAKLRLSQQNRGERRKNRPDPGPDPERQEQYDDQIGPCVRPIIRSTSLGRLGRQRPTGGTDARSNFAVHQSPPSGVRQIR